RPFQTLRAIDDHDATLRRPGQRGEKLFILVGTIADAIRLEHQALQWRAKNVADEIGRDAWKKPERGHYGARSKLFQAQLARPRPADERPVDLDLRSDCAEWRHVRRGKRRESIGADFHRAAAAKQPSSEVEADLRDRMIRRDEQ